MKFYEATSVIDPRAEARCAVLTNAPGNADWDSGGVRVEGKTAPQETMKVVSEANPQRAFPVKVTEFAPGERMVWSGRMPLGLFKGVRTFRLAPEGDATRFTMREEYTGPMLPMIWRSMPDLGPSLEEIARGLKARAERG